MVSKLTLKKTTMKNLICTLAIITAFMPVCIKAQDIHFSQISETPLLRNPALAGIFSGDIRIQSVYRNQWNSVTVPFQTTSVNGEYRLPVGQGDDFLTVGAQILHDKAGDIALTATHLLPALNYHKSIGSERNTYLSLGFMCGYVQRRFDRSKVTTNNQFDGVNYNPGIGDGENFNRTSYSYFDGSAGLSLNSQIGENENNNFYIGLAYHHFNRPRNISFFSDYEMEMSPKWVGSAGVRVSMTDYSFFTVEADYTSQGPYSQFIIGSLYTWKLDDSENPRYSLHAGAYLRWNDAIIPVTKLACGPLSVAVSYDANISSLKAASNGRGGFELGLTYQKSLDRNNNFRESIRCPKF